MGFIKAISISDLKPGEGKMIEVEEKAIAIFNIDGEFFAIDNTCAHRGGPLGEGFLDGKTVTCPWHGWKYDVTTGKAVMFPNTVAKYNVKIQGNDVLVEM